MLVVDISISLYSFVPIDIYSVYLSNTEWVTEKWVPGLCKNFGNLLDEGHEGKLDVDGSLDFIYSRIRSDVH